MHSAIYLILLLLNKFLIQSEDKNAKKICASSSNEDKKSKKSRLGKSKACYAPKEERSFRVVARGLHAETDKQDITEDLTALDRRLTPCEQQHPDHVNFSVNQDTSQLPSLGIPVSSSSSFCSLPAASPFPPGQDSISAVPVSRQPAQDRLLQQILSLQAAQQKNVQAQSSSMEKLLSRLDQMMASLMQVHTCLVNQSSFPASSRVPNV
ncbi:hypothetical protein ACLKA7_007911 [Drosophila subpalustris]